MAYATVQEVEVNLGRSLSELQKQQVEQWIRWAETTIADRMGPLEALNQDTLNMVLVEAVTARLRNPEAATQVAVQIDDGRIERRYQKATGLIEIRPEWWAALGWLDQTGAFTVTPYGVPDWSVADDWR